MKLVLTSKGNNANFISWLSEYKVLGDQIVINVDTEKNVFQSTKASSKPETLRAINKISQISFEDAGYSVTQDESNNTKVGIGIYAGFTSFIDFISAFSNSEHTITIEFAEARGVNEAINIHFENNKFKLKYDCCDLDQLYVPDPAKLEYAYTLSKPVTIDITSEQLNDINKVINLVYAKASKDEYTQNLFCIKIVDGTAYFEDFKISASGSTYDPKYSIKIAENLDPSYNGVKIPAQNNVFTDAIKALPSFKTCKFVGEGDSQGFARIIIYLADGSSLCMMGQQLPN